MVLICLKVKYGYPLSTLYGFLQRQDFLTWEAHLLQFSSELVANEIEGCIFWLVNNCIDIRRLTDQVYNLPLLKEEFFEMQVFELKSFRNLDCLFNDEFNK